MTRVDTEAITRERLARWAERLRERHATPLVLVGVGHDERSGQVTVVAVDEAEVPDEVVAACLRYAYLKLTGA